MGFVRYIIQFLDALCGGKDTDDTILKGDVMSNLHNALEPFERWQQDPNTNIPPGKAQPDETDIYEDGGDEQKEAESGEMHDEL